MRRTNLAVRDREWLVVTHDTEAFLPKLGCQVIARPRRPPDAHRLVGSKRRAKLHPESALVDQVNSLLEQPKGTSNAALRDRALLETMYACGLRASEAITLKVSELDTDAGVLIAHGKG